MKNLPKRSAGFALKGLDSARHASLLQADCRRLGAGRLLVAVVVEKARKCFPVLGARAPDEAFALYRALGFDGVHSQFATHRIELVRPRSGRGG